MAQATRIGQLTFSDYFQRVLREAIMWALFAIALLLVACLLTYSPEDPGWTHIEPRNEVRNLGGPVGAWFADVALSLFGYFAYLLPFAIAWSAWLTLRGMDDEAETRVQRLALRLFGFLLTLAAGSALAGILLAAVPVNLPYGIAGGVGQLVGGKLVAHFHQSGALLLLAPLFLAGITFFTGLSWLRVLDGIGWLTLLAWDAGERLVRWFLRPAVKDKTPGHASPPAPPLHETGSHSARHHHPGPLTGFGPRSEEESVDERELVDERDLLELSGSATGSQAGDFPDHRRMEQVGQTGLAGQKGMAGLAGPTGQGGRGGQSDQSRLAEVAGNAPATAIPRTRAGGRPSADSAGVEREPLTPRATTTFQGRAATGSQAKHEPASRTGTSPSFSLDDLLEDDPDAEISPGVGASSSPRPDPVTASTSATRSRSRDGTRQPISAAVPPLAPASVPAPAPAPAAAPALAPAGQHGRVGTAPTPAPLAPWEEESSELPPLALLDEARRSGKGYTKEQLDELSRQVEIKLADFGVSVQVVAVHPGPVVTLFEMMPAPGTKASKITGLSRDIARALSTISVRVVEVIPGKSVIGLEIPNNFRETVVLREILGSNAYLDAKSPLTIALGTNISGHPVVADLARMPHALIAGTTGSGKSVALNAMILSLVYKAGPRDVRLIMVDPKMLELSVYEGIPHLLTPVVTDMKEAANALRWCVAEMERRYKLMARLGVRNITGYNRKIAEAEAAGEPIPDPLYSLARDLPTAMESPPALVHLPYIVVIIDELADMMMVVGKKVEELIARLAQKARASGIHLLLATQRPSVDVLTGLIKANIPTRMAFQVSSRIDSRTILDQMGAEHLLGNGDMLYLPPGTSIPHRVHGAFVDDHEVQQVVEFLRAQGEPEYIDTILMDMGDGIPGIDPEPRANGDLEDTDPLFDEAVQIVVESRRASISGVQRRLKIGYNRAARMIEEMERIGIVGPAETNGNREVLAPPPVD